MTDAVPTRPFATATDTGSGGLQTFVTAGPSTIVADISVAQGGLDLGPDPHELVAAGLAACTTMTLRLYANRKGWTVSHMHVEVFSHFDKDQTPHERFERVIVCHGVRQAEDLAYRDYFANELPRHEHLGEQIAAKLLYYPAVTREPFVYRGHDHQGRLTSLLDSGRLAEQLGIEPLDPERDRAMICGSPQMLADFRAILDARGFAAAPRIGTPGQYVFERAFVEK